MDDRLRDLEYHTKKPTDSISKTRDVNYTQCRYDSYEETRLERIIQHSIDEGFQNYKFECDDVINTFEKEAKQREEAMLETVQDSYLALTNNMDEQIEVAVESSLRRKKLRICGEISVESLEDQCEL